MPPIAAVESTPSDARTQVAHIGWALQKRIRLPIECCTNSNTMYVAAQQAAAICSAHMLQQQQQRECLLQLTWNTA